MKWCRCAYDMFSCFDSWIEIMQNRYSHGRYTGVFFSCGSGRYEDKGFWKFLGLVVYFNCFVAYFHMSDACASLQICIAFYHGVHYRYYSAGDTKIVCCLYKDFSCDRPQVRIFLFSHFLCLDFSLAFFFLILWVNWGWKWRGQGRILIK